MNTRRITIRQPGRDGAVILRRAIQELKKDGSPKQKPARPTPAHLVVYPNGDYRYYNARGTLARSRVSDERRIGEEQRDMAWAKRATLAQLAR